MRMMDRDSDQETDRDQLLSATLESLPGLFGCSEDGFGKEFYFSEISHALGVLQGLNRQRQERTLCDVIIRVEGSEFPCHRNVLAACSPYFLAMFTGDMRERVERHVSIEGVDAQTMQELIDYAYTSDIAVTSRNAQRLLAAANLLQLTCVRDACCSFLRDQMEPGNVLGMHVFAEAHACTILAEHAFTYALKNFSAVAVHDELLLLPKDKLVEIIASDQLHVVMEDVVLQAVVDWVKHDLESRLPILPEVLSHVRLPLVNPYFLFDSVEENTFLTDSAECRSLIDEAMKYYVLKDRMSELQSSRTHPRRCNLGTHQMVAIGGEIHNKTYLNSMDCYNLERGKWVRLRELPFARCHHACAVSGGNTIYVSGGFNKSKSVLDSVLRYEPNLDKWIKVAAMITPRARHGMASVDGYVYVMGGYDGQSRIASVERYCPTTNTWALMEPMSVALSRCQAAGLHGYLYVAGGTSEPNNSCVDFLQRYSAYYDTWEFLSPMPVPRCLGGLVAAQGQLYAVGGTEEMVRASQKLTKYDPTHDCWREMAEIIEPRFDAGVTSIGNKIYLLSGHDGENSFYHSIEEYNIDENQWTIMSSTSLPYGRCRFGCVALNIPPMQK